VKVLTGCLFVLLGLIAGFVLAAVLGLLLVPVRPADSGGREMFIFFGLAPLGGLLGAICGIIYAVLRNGPTPPE
jgi:cytosine/uracil/thiamine/allantoin permease